MFINISYYINALTLFTLIYVLIKASFFKYLVLFFPP